MKENNIVIEQHNSIEPRVIIDNEFKNLIPPLTKDEYDLLEKSIVERGLENPLVLWNGILVDGHNRYEICTKHNIPYGTREMLANDRDEVVTWIIKNQLGRRNLTPYQKGEIGMRLIPLYEQEAKQHQGKRNDLGRNIGQNVDRSSESMRVNKRLAQATGLSHTTMAKIKKIQSLADDKMIDKLRKNEISISKAYNKLCEKPTSSSSNAVKLNSQTVSMPNTSSHTETSDDTERSRNAIFDMYTCLINERVERGSQNPQASLDINRIMSLIGDCNNVSDCIQMLYDMKKMGDLFTEFIQNMLHIFVRHMIPFEAIMECMKYLEAVNQSIQDTGFWAGHTAKHYYDIDSEVNQTE